MSKVISFISRKGGTGKTTNAINLATSLHSFGDRVMIIETDTNYTLSTLRKLELFNNEISEKGLFQIKGSTDESIADEIGKLKASNTLDYIIIDSAGKTTDEGIKKLCLESNAVVVPSSLTQNDLLVTYQTITDLTPAKDLNSNLKIFVLPNRIHSLTKHKTIVDAMDNLDAEILPAAVPQKNLFVNFSTITPEKEYLPIAQHLKERI